MFATANFTDYYAPYGVPGAKPQGRSLEPVPFPVGARLAEWRDRLASRITLATLGAHTTLEEDLSGKPVDANEIERRKREDIRPKGAALIGALSGAARAWSRRWSSLRACNAGARGARRRQASYAVRRQATIGARQASCACGGFEHNAGSCRAHIGYALHPLSTQQRGRWPPARAAGRRCAR
jgi:hypothetical protein